MRPSALTFAFLCFLQFSEKEERISNLDWALNRTVVSFFLLC